MRGLLKRLFSRGRELDESSVEELRKAFKSSYHQFRLLVSANHQALAIMAELQHALKGTQPFGMVFVQDRCTRVAASVFQIVKHLNQLGPGEYEKLYERFEEIKRSIAPFCLPAADEDDGALVVSLQGVDASLAGRVGGKMANLGELGNRVQLRVPDGFVMTAAAYRRFMQHNDLQSEIERRMKATELEQLDRCYAVSAEIQRLIVNGSLPQDLEQSISENYQSLVERQGTEINVAMRSSALGEGAAGASFAGQFRSELNVNAENLFQAYKEVVASKYSMPAITYRLNRDIRDEDVAMCVGCLRMIDAVAGGVVYSRNPVNPRDDSIVINSVWGVPVAVVDGRTATDTMTVERGSELRIREKQIPVKKMRFVCYPKEGIRRMLVSDEEGRKASLNDEQIREVARMAILLQEHYQAPQVIEWVLEKDRSISLLQSRPLQPIDGPIPGAIETMDDRRAEAVILQGEVTASPGVAAGPVFIVKKDMDVLRFPEGAVLVTDQSSSRWAALLNRTAAVVAEQGSVSGHLANVAREFAIPALFGAKDATGKLKNDQLVTVDANGMSVYDGLIHALLETTGESKTAVHASPAFSALEAAARSIVPLNLLDPDAPSFRAENCTTFHDIIRFCHEKSVSKMLSFGKDHCFPERFSRQLTIDVPMNWWVLNLDDGFREKVTGKHVNLEDIISIPMLALWEGITRFPWEGPPPIDAKGFLSVMFMATRDPALVPGAPSSYDDRNYFMISKHYCSLTSRLGFHFSIVETLVGDEPNENYISFQFKGGGASDDRRHKRVLFVKDILQEHGFGVEVRDDHLMARLGDREQETMKAYLRIIGHLIICTRQLDMIMSNAQLVGSYKAKITKNIDEILGSS